ncbi:xanthine dehydrogenase family protein molybdopterin-binding subunit [Saccharopolyspora mangrovi]|uniref:Molybdopterin cofactor-binding domain-containing protein n=1 Tax=Saccharopolyspora mangrovi TaxID=3082379 RepID=A0ABU6AIE1_9PSEU|nr:molybdopterin cofactor-binding domain-containing protein [Saccharopolyspora sp. S2-29]MEB3371332.1 molybdopterin cofactor-binding domain-containing protein [Saccharopolyspora sp. S2-29]
MTEDARSKARMGRRRFLTYLVAAPTVTVAARWGLGGEAAEAVPSPPRPSELYDVGDFYKNACEPTKNMVLLEVSEQGEASLWLHRMEVGQGITTACAMLVAEELNLPLSKVHVPLRDADPALLFNQLTGGSTAMRTVYGPIRQAAAEARARMVAAAARQWDISVGQLTTRDGLVAAPDGRTATYGSLAAAAADPGLSLTGVKTKSAAEFSVIGKPAGRIDARKMVTGQFHYTLDLDVIPGAKPCLVHRAPTIQGTPKRLRNDAEVRAMPGVIDIAVIESGVAILADTFGQAWDAKKALRVDWNPGTVDGLSNDDIFAKLEAATVPLAVPDGLVDTIDAEFRFAPVSHAPLESNTAVADVRADRAEIWSGLQTPIFAQQVIAEDLGLPQDAVKVHVVQSGGAFGRRLFHDGAMEAARASKAFGRPVKLMWTRTDDMRHGRMRGPSFHRVRATVAGGQVASYEHRITETKTDFSHGIGELITAKLSGGAGNYTYAQSFFNLMVECPYNFGAVTEVLHEPEDIHLNTASWRSVYSAMVRGAEELVVDQIAAKLGKDAHMFRREYLKHDDARAVLDKVATEGGWGRKMPSGHAQGIALHVEHRSSCAFLVEMDATDPRRPRVYRATIAADVGRPINPLGIEAQMISGLTDGISTTLRAGLHIKDGLPLEGSYSQSHFARQKDSPREVKVFVMPPSREEPGGVGELPVPAAVGAIACAYARATGTWPRHFPINFDVDFNPFPPN